MFHSFTSVARFSACLAIVATAAQAKPSAPHFPPFDTPSVVFDVIDSDSVIQFVVGGDAGLLKDEEYKFTLPRERLGDLVLVEAIRGYSDCPVNYVWIHTGLNDVRATEDFGNCQHYQSLIYDAETVTVAMPDLKTAAGTILFVYDGNTINEAP